VLPFGLLCIHTQPQLAILFTRPSHRSQSHCSYDWLALCLLQQHSLHRQCTLTARAQRSWWGERHVTFSPLTFINNHNFITVDWHVTCCNVLNFSITSLKYPRHGHHRQRCISHPIFVLLLGCWTVHLCLGWPSPLPPIGMYSYAILWIHGLFIFNKSCPFSFCNPKVISFEL